MNASHEIEARLRETAEKLLREQKVSVFLGYEKATLPFRTTPLFLTHAEEVNRLSWNPFCAANLAVYLPRLFATHAGVRDAGTAVTPTVGIVLKGCDMRSVMTLIQERQVRRENLVLVEIACSGIVDRRKAEKALVGRQALGAGEDGQGNIRVVVDDGSEIALRLEDVSSQACRECRYSASPHHDVIVGVSVEGEKADGSRRGIAEFESKPLESRWAIFQETFSKCIRCNACRQACPMCYCKTCVFDQNRPRWIGAGTESSDVALYHLMRALHMAGRCTGCGACERACPEGIDVRLLTRKLCVEVEELYGYRPGEALEGIPLMSSFAMDDPQEFVTEP
jgi:ferredoxin